MSESNDDLDRVVVALDKKKREPKVRHCVTMFGDIDRAPRKNWIVRGLLGAGELSCLYGPPGCGKSVLAGDLAAHVAAGDQWFDRHVAHGSVLYVAAERPQIVMRRFAALRIGYGWKQLPLAIVSGMVDLRSNRADVDAIIAHAETLHRATSLAVNLIVIDTLSRVLNGGDENSPKDMGVLVAALADLQSTTGAHILGLHHVPHEANRMRGHGALLAACDATVRVEKLAGVRVATLEKSNDAIEGAKLLFNLDSVEIHRDQTGEITSAPVVVPSDDDAYQVPPHKKLSKRQQLALETLSNCILDRGEPSPEKFKLPAGIKVVAVDTWRAEMFSRGVLDRQAKNPREDFRRVKIDLQARHLIAEQDDLIWIASTTHQASQGERQ